MHADPRRHTPTTLFSVDGRPGREVYELLAARGVNAPAGSFYALEASRWIGLGDTGAVRAGLAPYTDEDDVDRLLAGVAPLCGCQLAQRLERDRGRRGRSHGSGGTAPRTNSTAGGR